MAKFIQESEKRMDEYKQQCEAAASRVNAAVVGLDPTLIITIITTVLPLLVNCFRREDEPDPARVQAALVRAYDRNPASLRRRMRVQIDRKSPENLTKGQALAIADAIIAQALDTSPAIVSRVCGG